MAARSDYERVATALPSVATQFSESAGNSAFRAARQSRTRKVTIDPVASSVIANNPHRNTDHP
jgi:hypothetical protein